MNRNDPYSETALQLHAVSYCYGQSRSQTERTVLAKTSLKISAGEFVSLVGPTGCGKSTLLKLCAGLLAPSSGHITVFNKPLDGINSHAGYMFQDEVLLPWLTVLENVVLGLGYRGMPATESDSLGRSWLTRVGLSVVADYYPSQLSGGMRKRVALAQTLILDPDIILMDEPFSSLDIQTRQLMENELLTLWEKKRSAVLFITHDLDEAIALADRVIVLSAGPGTHPIGEFSVPLARPRDVTEIRTHPEFVGLHKNIWNVLRDEVLKSYQLNLSHHE
ncbi:ABC transporter ATP-binding protein [Serratia ureilytica]|uniref:ABC transporter ATP-binding protein n=1 Tax=Serratia ureilytica TaxID=300181 RepID=UPI001AA1C573|nr:ABC transporter ATP-binding protein [Serratia ureilytica]MBO1811297.1 ABC transporter ATP-binding protein [Serratia ureilytica]